MISAICNSAKEEFLSGVHQPNDRYKLALFLEGAILSEETTQYNAVNEADGMGYETGGKSLSTPVIQTKNGETSMTFASPISWENASITARGAMIYNATKGNKALAVFDFGKPITSTNGPFTVKIPNEGAIILS